MSDLLRDAFTAVTKNIPDYLKLHLVEGPPTDEPDLADLPAFERACQAVTDLTGWQLKPVPTRREAERCTWNAPLDPEDRLGGYLGAQRVEDASTACPWELVHPLAQAIVDLTNEAQRARRVVWQREAELAAGIPVTIRGDESRHLATRLEAVLKGGAEAIGCQAAALYLLDEATSHLKLRSGWRLPSTRFLDPPRPLRGSVADLEALVGHAVALEDTALLPHWKVPEDFPAALCVPVSSASTPLGTLWFFADSQREFSTEQTHLAEIIAGRLVSDLEREVLLQEGFGLQTDRGTIDLLAKWQNELCPHVAPHCEGWSVAGETKRADRAGGDLFDWCILPDGRLAISIGHACGPPIDAALTAGSLQVACRSLTDHRHDARQMLTALNESLWTNSTGDRFASMMYGLIDLEQGTMQFALAGQIGGLIHGRSAALTLTGNRQLLGIDPDINFEQETIELKPGQSLLLASHGVYDSLDDQGEHLDDVHIRKMLRKLGDTSPMEQVAHVLDQRLAGQPHDRTVICVRRS